MCQMLMAKTLLSWPCEQSCEHSEALAALHLEVNVLQGDAMARGVLAAAQLDGVLGDGRPPVFLCNLDWLDG